MATQTLEINYDDDEVIPTAADVHEVVEKVFRLEATSPSDAEGKARSHDFTPATEAVIGRDSSACTLLVDGPSISRRHCRVFSLGTEVFLQDLSANGTFVNGKLVGKDARRSLSAGDKIQLLHPKAPDAESYQWEFLPPPGFGAHASGSAADANYFIGEVLGAGAYATVRLGRSKSSGKSYAVKIIDKRRFALSDDFAMNKLQCEVELLRKLQHPNIIGIVDVYDDEKSFTIVLDLIRGGDLFDYIVGRGFNPLTEAEAKHLFIQLVEALLYFHSKGIVHRDLKPENVLIDVREGVPITSNHQADAPNISPSDVTLKVTDFGLAKFCGNNSMMKTVCGTPAYLAPEVMGKTATGYSRLVDVWSSGVILYILLSGTPPRDPQSGLLNFPPKLFKKVSASAKDFISKMLQVSPSERWDVGELLKHPWLKDENIKGRELAEQRSSLTYEQTMMTPNPMMGVTVEQPAGKLPEATKKREREDTVPTSSAPEPQSKGTVTWMWKNTLTSDDLDDASWTSYPQKDSDRIEQYFQRKYKTCKADPKGEYRVAFEGMFQFCTGEPTKQRPVRRVVDLVPNKR